MAALPTMPDRAGADIVLVNPRFEASYWGLEGALPLLGKRAAMPVASLPLLAALTPPPHRVRIVDENVTPIDFDDIARADIVGLTGMSVQRAAHARDPGGAGAAADARPWSAGRGSAWPRTRSTA